MSIRPTLLPLLLLSVAPACGGDDGGPPVIASIVIDPDDGGTHEVIGGELAGLEVVVPPGALSRPVQLTVARAVPAGQPGFRALGRAAILGPGGLRLAQPITVTMPFELTPYPGNDVTVMVERGGSIVELAPASSPSGEDLVAVDTASLSRFWAAERLFGAFGVRALLTGGTVGGSPIVGQ